MMLDIEKDSEIVTFTSTTQTTQLTLPNIPIGMTLSVSNTMPFDIVCNGFSLKETILEVLDKYPNIHNTDKIAEEIKLELAYKLRIKERII